MTRIAIVGGGIAGLTLAHAVRGTGLHDVVVLEAGARAGGVLRSERVDGYLVESGPNGYLDDAPETQKLVSSLGLADRVVDSDDRSRRRYIYRRGSLHPLPGGPGAFLRSPLLSAAAKLRLAGEPFVFSRGAADETVGAFAARRLGQEAADLLADVMVAGVFAGDPAALSMRAAFPSVWALEADHGGLIRGLLAKARTSRKHPGEEPRRRGRLTSFAGGMEDLITALVEALGSAVRTDAVVKSLERATGGYRIVLDRGEIVDAQLVAMCCPAAVAACIVENLDRELAAELRGIDSAPLAVVALGYDEAVLPRPLDGFGFLIPRSEALSLLGVLWDSSIFPSRAPEGRVLLRAMLGGAREPRVLERSDDGLVEQTRRDLATTMGLRAAPCFVRVVRHPGGIPQYNVGHLDRLARIDAAESRHEGLILGGNPYRGVSVNACIAEARKIAARVCGQRRPKENVTRPLMVKPPALFSS